MAGWVFSLFGWCMIGHFLFLAVCTFYRGTPEDMFWISHVGTLLGGLGAVFRNRRLISIAVVSLIGHHLFWLIDTLGWLLTGSFPFGTTGYLEGASPVDWLQSANHFFSVPFLLILAYRQDGVETQTDQEMIVHKKVAEDAVFYQIKDRPQPNGDVQQQADDQSRVIACLSFDAQRDVRHTSEE